jgi:YjbE family integral membrane protein
LLLWIGIKLVAPGDEDEHGNVKGSTTIWSAVKTIIIADLVMSIDNVIAIAAAASLADPEHQLGLVIFGLIVSVPVIVWGSTIVLKLIERYPLVVTAGGALLGWIAGGMMITDPVVVARIGEVPATLQYGASIAGAVLVVVWGAALAARQRRTAVDSDA